MPVISVDTGGSLPVSLLDSGETLAAATLTLRDRTNAVVLGPVAYAGLTSNSGSWSLAGVPDGDYEAQEDLTDGLGRTFTVYRFVALGASGPAPATQPLVYTPPPSTTPETWTVLTLTSLTQGQNVIGPFAASDSAEGMAASSHTLTSYVPDPPVPLTPGTATARYDFLNNGVPDFLTATVTLTSGSAVFADLAGLAIGEPQFDVATLLSNQAFAGSAAALHVLMPAVLNDDGSAYNFAAAPAPQMALIDASRNLVLLPVTDADFVSGDWLEWAGANPGWYARLEMASVPGPAIYEVRLKVGSLTLSAGLIVTV